MSEPIISVCISVHNTAKYLPRCLDSIFTQNNRNVEIVLVNNGSVDESEAIMHLYKNKYFDYNIKIYAQDDLGLSQGRQTGVDHATGKYITFIDADDFYIGNSLQSIINFFSINDVDIVEFKSKRDDEIVESNKSGICNAHEILKEYFLYMSFPSMLWLRAYKRELFESSVLPSIYTNNEDCFAFPCLLYKANKIGYLNEILHVYSTDNEQGVMHTLKTDKSNEKKLYDNMLKTLFIPDFLEYKIGAAVLNKEFNSEYCHFKKTIMELFIFSKTYCVSYKEKLERCRDILHFEDTHAVIKFINNHLGHSTLDKSIRYIGVGPTYYLRRILV